MVITLCIWSSPLLPWIQTKYPSYQKLMHGIKNEGGQHPGHFTSLICFHVYFSLFHWSSLLQKSHRAIFSIYGPQAYKHCCPKQSMFFSGRFQKEDTIRISGCTEQLVLSPSAAGREIKHKYNNSMLPHRTYTADHQYCTQAATSHLLLKPHANTFLHNSKCSIFLNKKVVNWVTD